MEDIGMKTVVIAAVAFATLMSIPLLAQPVDATENQDAAATAGSTHVSDSAHAGAAANASPGGTEANGAANSQVNAGEPGEPGFGDEAASHEWEMSSVSGELEGKLNSKTARVGDRVVLKTTEKVQTSDGTVIPRGSRLVGHVTQVQAHDDEHANAQMGVVFDRVELKNGQSVAIYTLLRGVSPSANALARSSTNSEDSFGAPMGGMGSMSGGGQAMGGGRSGSGGGGILGGTGRTVSDTGHLAGGTLDRTAATTSSVSENAGAGLD
jgi:hypothetical protein